MERNSLLRVPVSCWPAKDVLVRYSDPFLALLGGLLLSLLLITLWFRPLRFYGRFNIDKCSDDDDEDGYTSCTDSSFTDHGSRTTRKRLRKRSNKMASPYDDKIGGNPIGLVQELCMSRRWPPPTYETEHEEGLPHERQFTIACVVYKYKEVGTGKSKKLAKRQAANKMWLRLKDMPIENNNLQLALEDDDEITHRVTHIGAEFGDLKNAKISTLNPQHSQKVSQFHKNLKSAYGEKLSELQTVILKNTDFNFVQFLQEIATEQQFEVTYVDIEEKSITGKNQCLVQLSTLPVAVCHGTGNSSKEAQSAAAHNALEYLKIMTKK